MFPFKNSHSRLKIPTTLFCLIFFTSFRVYEGDPKFLYYQCPNTTTFTRNSPYFSNLRTVLSSLSSRNAAAYSAGFQNASAGNTNDAVYGLFLCRGDVSPQVCRDCVVFSSNDTLQLCPNETEAAVWYDECMLRYSNRNIFSLMDPSLEFYMRNTQNVSAIQFDQFNRLLASMMNGAALEAAKSPRKVAGEKMTFTPFQTMYGLVQCTTDITRQDCESCIRQAISQLPDCCNGRIGGRVVTPSCFIRYELYPFYNESAVAAAAAAAPPPLAAAPPRQSPGSGSPPQRAKKGRSSTVLIIAIVVPVAASILLFIAGCFFLATRARDKYDAAPAGDDSLQFDFSTIEAATNKFSVDNKLGGGGFGEVYKGMLPNGQQIAVKRLSKKSAQGAGAFKNEAVLVAKLQHRNLVRLLGFCLEGEEKILVYEFVPNKSLDYFVFDPERQGLLDWSRRYKIIRGVARGILYLHQDSRLTIVHRDLKTSNILLDEDMNPKISDFGMARIFGVDQTQDNTERIVGTYGYMSPEYAMHGQFSMKSDVYSFGVLVLEIISGKKNSSFCKEDGIGDLITYAWRLWRDGTPLELLDQTTGENYQRDEVTRCIHIGLLCVQEDPAVRPTMATIVLMLNSYSVTLPVPQQPGFFVQSREESDPLAKGIESDQTTSKSTPWSVDDASITELHPR